ncbi:MAG: hypothetical protein IJ507_07255 [Clostridia bacterium]|nr:hypothetical protein [Clostridia bacterium]
MNKKQRIQSVLRGEKPDRVPVSWYTHFPDQRDNTVADQVAWAKKTDMDMLCVETDGYMQFDCGKTDLSNPGVLAALRPHRAHDIYIEGQVDRAKRIAEGLQDGAAVTYMIFTPYSTIKHSTGSETLVMDLLREHPEAVRHAMEVIEEDNFLLMERLSREAGLDGIFLSLQNCEIDRYTAEEYRGLLAPWDDRLIMKAAELFPFTLLHLCAWRGVPNRLEEWRRHRCEVINWACHIETDMGLKAGRDFFHPEAVLMGGFDNRACGILHWGNKKQIKEYTYRLLDGAGTQRLILGPDCSVQSATPPEHLRWVAEACEEYAKR